MNCNEEEGVKICSQVGIPQVDNTALECVNGYSSTKCTIHPDAISYLGLEENTGLGVIIDTLVLSLQSATARVIILESKIETLGNE